MTSLTGFAALSSSGVVLSMPHAAAMQSSLPILQKNYKFTKVFFWGKLLGKTGDYLIAKGVEESVTVAKFFFCQDGVSWAELPGVTEAMMEAVAKVSTHGLILSGEISTALPIPADPLPEGEEPPEEEPETQYVTEIERLAVMVCTIDMECAMCPAGALMKKADHSVVASPTFTGLSYDAANMVGSYVFMNKPKEVGVNESALKASSDFLTSCADMVPKGALVFRFDVANNIVTTRNLLWPGAMAYSVVGMPVHGYCYVGDGLKNTDIAFMLP